jgi:hypothetical protein
MVSLGKPEKGLFMAAVFLKQRVNPDKGHFLVGVVGVVGVEE